MPGIALTTQHAKLSIRSTTITNCVDVLRSEVGGKVWLSEIPGTPGAKRLTMTANHLRSTLTLPPRATSFCRRRASLMPIQLTSMD